MSAEFVGLYFNPIGVLNSFDNFYAPTDRLAIKTVTPVLHMIVIRNEIRVALAADKRLIVPHIPMTGLSIIIIKPRDNNEMTISTNGIHFHKLINK